MECRIELGNIKFAADSVQTAQTVCKPHKQKRSEKGKRSQWDSNPRPLDPESNAISTPLCDRWQTFAQKEQLKTLRPEVTIDS